jgi:hypothetical protein
MRMFEPMESQERAWKKWVADRPDNVRAVAERFDPWTLYWHEKTKQRVFVIGFDEVEKPGQAVKVTLRVGVSGEYNLVTHERQVFGLDPDELVECDLPKDDEQLGSMDLPVEVCKSLLNDYPDGIPQQVWADLIAEHPVKQKGKRR